MNTTRALKSRWPLYIRRRPSLPRAGAREGGLEADTVAGEGEDTAVAVGKEGEVVTVAGELKAETVWNYER